MVSSSAFVSFSWWAVKDAAGTSVIIVRLEDFHRLLCRLVGEFHGTHFVGNVRLVVAYQRGHCFLLDVSKEVLVVVSGIVRCRVPG